MSSKSKIILDSFTFSSQRSVMRSGHCNVIRSVCRGSRRLYILCCLEEVHLKQERQKGIYHPSKSSLTGSQRLRRRRSLTLQPIASSVCKTTMVATVDTAITLVSSRTTGQKVRTSTEPEITMATRISVQRNHSNGMIHKTW